MKFASRVSSPIDVETRRALDLRPGDTVRVKQKIVEGKKTRVQAFEGILIARKHGKEAGATFTVRKVASGVGMEKIFPLYSPVIEKIEVIKRGKVRRSKLYFVRRKAAREVSRKLKQEMAQIAKPVVEIAVPVETEVK